MISRNLQIAIAVVALVATACTKQVNADAAANLLYKDSILYLQAGSTNQVVYPVHNKKGRYTAFPEGLSLDENTGAINVSKSETGLRYMVFFDAADGCSVSSSVVVSGINYSDHYYNLASGDSIATPTYNALQSSNFRGSFQVSAESFSSAVAVSQISGAINLAATVRTGLFGETPVNNTKKDVPITYRINDPSNNALNSITVRLYYYNSVKEVPEYLTQLLAERESAFEPFMSGRSFTKKIKARPPCIIIIAH